MSLQEYRILSKNKRVERAMKLQSLGVGGSGHVPSPSETRPPRHYGTRTEHVRFLMDFWTGYRSKQGRHR